PRFAVSWSSIGPLRAGTVVEFTGSVHIADGGRTVLAAASRVPRRLILPQATHDTTVDFSFSNLIREATGAIPYAMIRILGPAGVQPASVGARIGWLYGIVVHLLLLVAAFVGVTGRTRPGFPKPHSTLDVRRVARTALRTLGPAVAMLLVCWLT